MIPSSVQLPRPRIDWERKAIEDAAVKDPATAQAWEKKVQRFLESGRWS